MGQTRPARETALRALHLRLLAEQELAPAGLVEEGAVHEMPALPSDEEVAAIAAEQEAGAAADAAAREAAENEATNAPADEAKPEGDAGDESKEG